MTPTTAASEWLSRDDAAKLARCEVGAINRDIAKHGLEVNSKGPRGKVMVRRDDLVRVGRLVAAVPGVSGAESADLLRAHELVADLRAASARLEGRLLERDALTVVLREQLGVKDTQIRQLQDMVNRFAASMQVRTAL